MNFSTFTGNVKSKAVFWPMVLHFLFFLGKPFRKTLHEFFLGMVAWYALSLYNGSVPRGKDKEKDYAGCSSSRSCDLEEIHYEKD